MISAKAAALLSGLARRLAPIGTALLVLLAVFGYHRAKTALARREGAREEREEATAAAERRRAQVSNDIRREMEETERKQQERRDREDASDARDQLDNRW